MGYIYQFDIAAVALAALLISLFLFGGGYPTRTRKALMFLMISAICSGVFDVITNFTLGLSGVPDFLNFLLKAAFLIGNNYCALVFFLYVVALTNAGNVHRIIAKSALVFTAVIILSSAFTGLIFKIKDGVYIRGPLYYYLYAVTFFAITYSIVLLVTGRKNVGKFQVTSVVVFIVVVLASIVAQLIDSALRLSTFACSLGLVLTYASIERPSDYLYKTSKCFNRTAFTYFIREHSTAQGKVVVACLQNDGYLRRTLNAEAWKSMILAMFDELHVVFGRKNVFYLDGGCFAAVSKNESEDEVVKKFAEGLPATFFSGGANISLSFQYFIVRLSDFAKNGEKLREAFDFIVRRKSAYSETVVRFTSAELDKLDREVLVLNAIREGIEKKTFKVYYQPIKDAKSGRFSSAEALIRLNDPVLGFISPEEFIPVAEKNGLIIPVGEFVFESVCDFWCKNNLADKGVSFIEVNLSTLQCMQKDLSSRLMEIMRKRGIKAGYINFEITETADATDRQAMLDNIAALVISGVAFSLDDYGTGYSNINYLSSLPIDIVKIDKSILWKAMEDEQARKIFGYTVKMIHDLKLKIVVEGVENEKMLSYLEETGVDYYQGFLFSRPLPEEDYLGFLENGKAGI
ncbi:MAG TPA: hypothetical protein DDW54_02165 [Clostridiales bacterium]|nr:hypothetical protein [Clostridiales bacterium]